MTRAELNQIPYLNSEIEQLKERMTRLRSSMEGLNRIASGLPHGTAEHDRLGADIAELNEMEQKLAKKVKLLEERLRQLDEEIAVWPSEYHEMFRLRFEKGHKWELVSKTTDYSIQHCKRVGGLFLRSLKR